MQNYIELGDRFFVARSSRHLRSVLRVCSSAQKCYVTSEEETEVAAAAIKYRQYHKNDASLLTHVVFCLVFNTSLPLCKAMKIILCTRAGLGRACQTKPNSNITYSCHSNFLSWFPHLAFYVAQCMRCDRSTIAADLQAIGV